jgi:hypothetical protein
LWFNICHFVLFLLAVVFSLPLRSAVSGYTFGIFKEPIVHPSFWSVLFLFLGCCDVLYWFLCHLPVSCISNVVGISELRILVCHLPVTCTSNVVGISGLCILICHLPVSCISNVVGISELTQRYRQHWKYKTQEDGKQ